MNDDGLNGRLHCWLDNKTDDGRVNGRLNDRLDDRSDDGLYDRLESYDRLDDG